MFLLLQLEREYADIILGLLFDDMLARSIRLCGHQNKIYLK